MSARIIPLSRHIAIAVLGTFIAGCSTASIAPDEPGLYAVSDEDEVQRLDGSSEWESETWAVRSNLPSHVRFVVVHPALAADSDPVSNKVKLRKVAWLRSEIGPDGKIGPVDGSQWAAPDLEELEVPVDYDHVGGRPDVVEVTPLQRLDEGLYSLQLRAGDTRLHGRLGVDWSGTDRQHYARVQCFDRYREDRETVYRRCSEQQLAVESRGLRIYLVDPDKRIVDGKSVLVLKGIVVNVSDEERRIPMLVGQLRDGNGQTIHRWTFSPQVERIPPGASASFQTVVNEAPEGVANVTVSFSPYPQLGQQQ